MIALLKERLRKWLGVEALEQTVKDQNETQCMAYAQTRQALTGIRELTKDLFHLGVDVHFKEPTQIIIVSKVNGGQVRQIACDIRHIKELDDLVTALKMKYNTDSLTMDVPRFMKERPYQF